MRGFGLGLGWVRVCRRRSRLLLSWSGLTFLGSFRHEYCHRLPLRQQQQNFQSNPLPPLPASPAHAHALLPQPRPRTPSLSLPSPKT